MKIKVRSSKFEGLLLRRALCAAAGAERGVGVPASDAVGVPAGAKPLGFISDVLKRKRFGEPRVA
jgi:hypothetical protein